MKTLLPPTAYITPYFTCLSLLHTTPVGQFAKLIPHLTHISVLIIHIVSAFFFSVSFFLSLLVL